MNKDFVSLKSIAAELYDHPKLKNMQFEYIVSCSVELIQITGCPFLFEEKEDVLEVKNHRASLPCDYYDIRQLKLEGRGMKHPYRPDAMMAHEITQTDEDENGKIVRKRSISTMTAISSQSNRPLSPMFKEGTNTFEDANFHPGADLTYKIQGNVVVVSIPEGCVRLAYLAMKVDEDGWPMIINNASFIRALKSYIKMKWFERLFECDELSVNAKNGNAILQNAQQDYYANIAQAQNSLLDISPEKMENIGRILKGWFPRMYDHASGYNDLNKNHDMKTH